MTKSPVIILASRSPRRQQMLSAIGIPYRIFHSDIDEMLGSKQSARRLAIELAEKKAAQYPRGNHLVISMDTIVAAGRKKLGKPENRQEAVEMLRLLSGRMHRVITGVCLRHGNRQMSDAEITRVYFRKIKPEEIDWYVESEEPYDKAGGYAIQGLARIFIDRIDGCYYNVIGFPISCFQRLLKRLGMSIHDLKRGLISPLRRRDRG